MQPHDHSLINDYLTGLNVPHTDTYTSDRLSKMPFQTMFGAVKLLEEYGITSEGYHLEEKEEIRKLKPPFLADTPAGFTIVKSVSPEEVRYITQGQTETVPLDKFLEAWDGTVILSYPSADASEPDYAEHARFEFLNRSKKWVLAGASLLLLVYLFISGGLWRDWSAWFITLIDLGGLYITYLLVQKSLRIHNPAADRVCKVLQEGGCDSILEMKASKFFGLFGWSEVGFAYFSVSLLTLLLLPGMLPCLALCNVCCLPFTVWSIWYQKFRAKKWCTLCVCVQLSLWLLFFCYLFGGWLRMAWPPGIQFFALGLAYLAVMLGINAVMPLMEKNNDN